MKTTTRFSFTALALAATVGCSAGTKNTQGGAGNTASPGTAGSTGKGGSSSGGGTFGIGGTFGSLPDGNVTDDGGDGGAICGSDTVMAQLVPLDLYVLMDSSKSMSETTKAGGTKWDGVKTAMSQFFTDGGSAGLGVGLKYFPGEQQGVPEMCTADNQCGSYGPCQARKYCIRTNTKTIIDKTSVFCVGDSDCASNESCVVAYDCGVAVNPCAIHGTGAACTGCTAFTNYCQGRDICGTPANYYATPDVAVDLLPGAAAALNSSLAGHVPSGYTPTGPALSGALDFARARLAAMPEHRVAIVLVTDGLPGGYIPGHPNADCTPADISGVADIAGGPKGAGGAPKVPTFVIGVFDDATAATAQTNLNMLAAKGGTETAVVVNTGQSVTQQLQDALKMIQSKAIACEYKIPGSGVDFGQVNVSFTSGASTTSLGHIPGNDPAQCDTRGGWYYDKTPGPGSTPTSIKACPMSCSDFQKDVNGQVKIVLGCPTIDVG